MGAQQDPDQGQASRAGNTGKGKPNLNDITLQYFHGQIDWKQYQAWERTLWKSAHDPELATRMADESARQKSQDSNKSGSEKDESNTSS